VTSRRASFVVAHPEALAAEATAAALARYPGLIAAGQASSATEALRFGVRADVAVIHGELVGAVVCARRLHALGVRVILVGGSTVSGPWPRVDVNAPLRDLVSAVLPDAVRADGRLRELTAREWQVLSLIAEGLAGKQIARALGISPKTVERHKTRIYAKLGVPNQAAAVGLVARQPIDHGEPRWNLSSM
jgi:DNA-binding CsgD family transcriptional regulator